MSESQERRGRIRAAAGFDVGSLGFEQVVHGVAVHFGGAAGAPCLPVEVDQAGLGRVFVARAAGDQDRAVDERQLVVFLEKDDDAVLEFDALGLLRLEFVQRGDGDFFPGFVLLGGGGEGDGEGEEEGEEWGPARQ